MEREILFRGKLSHSGVWVEGNLIKDRNGNKYIIPFNVFEPDGHHLIIDSDEAWRVDSATVGQFTGMTDKKGEKLFEGDIYSMGEKNILYVVIFDKSQFIGKQVGNRSLAGLEYWKSDIEIVGSVHDNPELL
jgi:hypothetical protein